MIMAATNAQVTINDNFESYPVGSYFGGHWSNWSGTTGAENLIVTNAQASSGTKSGAINTNGQDVILKVPTAFEGYIPISGECLFQQTNLHGLHLWKTLQILLLMQMIQCLLN